MSEPKEIIDFQKYLKKIPSLSLHCLPFVERKETALS